MRMRLGLYFVSVVAVAMAGCTSTSPLIPYQSPNAQPVVYDQPAPQQPKPKKIRRKPVPPQPIVIEKESGGGGGGGGGGWGG